MHHLLTNNNYASGSRWSMIFEGYLKKNGYEDLLSLDRNWNKLEIPHANRAHPEQYHQWIFDAMQKFNKVAQGDSQKFLKLWDKYVRAAVKECPWVLFDAWWSKYGDEWWKWWEDLIL